LTRDAPAGDSGSRPASGRVGACYGVPRPPLLSSSEASDTRLDEGLHAKRARQRIVAKMTDNSRQPERQSSRRSSLAGSPRGELNHPGDLRGKGDPADFSCGAGRTLEWRSIRRDGRGTPTPGTSGRPPARPRRRPVAVCRLQLRRINVPPTPSSFGDEPWAPVIWAGHHRRIIAPRDIPRESDWPRTGDGRNQPQTLGPRHRELRCSRQSSGVGRCHL
jgi:hypothetical protein